VPDHTIDSGINQMGSINKGLLLWNATPAREHNYRSHYQHHTKRPDYPSDDKQSRIKGFYKQVKEAQVFNLVILVVGLVLGLLKALTANEQVF